MSEARARTLISVDDLASRLGAGSGVVLLHVRDENTGKPLEGGVIPGALDVYLASDFSGAPTKAGGKRPLPDVGAFEANARKWGVKPDNLVVVYDDTSGAQASRAWWTFRWAGLDNVRILDGGIIAWKAAGRQLADQPASAPGGGTVNMTAGNMPTIEADEAQALAREGVLLDARGKAAYVGAPAEPGKPAAGHIPGAILAPSAANIGPDACFKPHEELCVALAEIGADGSRRVGVYCGSGNAAAHKIAALHAAGVEAALYVGSWSAWSADPERPVATGDEPG
jgi:thiosulfate/3-mercaptopyruvate sulfurtransferase